MTGRRLDARVRHWAVTYRWLIVLCALVTVLGAVVASQGVHGRLVDGGYTDESAEFRRAEHLLTERYAAGSPQILLVARAERPVDSGQTAVAGHRLAARLGGDPGVASVRSPWTSTDPRLVSADRHAALLLLAVRGDDQQANRTGRRIIREYAGDLPPFRVEAAGRQAINRYAEDQSGRDLLRAELIGIPLVALALLLIFGSFLACVLPVAVGLISIAGATAVLNALARHSSVNVFTLNIISALGFGLAVDYSLIMMSRFREELAGGRAAPEAVRMTMRTAGRTVLVSAAMIALSLSALLFFPTSFHRSLGAGALVVVCLAAVAALVVQPALLALFGHRVGRRRIPLPWLGKRHAHKGEFWYRLAAGVLRRPVVVLVASATVLLLLAAPFASARMGFIDEHWLPRNAAPRLSIEQARKEFPVLNGTTLTALAPDAAHGSAEADRVGRLYSRLPAVDLVTGPEGTFHRGQRVSTPEPVQRAAGTWYAISSQAEPYSGTAQRLVADVRGAPGPGTVLVAGESAALVDMKRSLAGHLVWAVALIIPVAMVLLFLYTGSVLVPVKAMITNLLSLGVSYGSIVVLFQHGLLSQLLGGSATQYTDPLIPAMVFCVAFGLSMDYEVLLVGRIREEYLRTGDTGTAVAEGLQRTGRLVTAAASTVVIALGALMSSSLAVLQLIGVALALAVAVDATVVRCLLVPAIMALAGRWNWWAPASLARLHGRLKERLPDQECELKV
ncbi:MMPL family transporter [Streptomyces noursei]|uniref:MMPL family transporter n=1 Tax=Streptomyces noursei TaxID=1971 RepID=UPI0016782538|nr:MMPL family transporter [Streptomyces noursei]MCZ1021162.1 MMPL family transporter [Streptomyces noursei]GGX54052.1 membrane protein [Streptomyces noursei]